MNSWDKVRAILAGDVADPPAASCWRHFFDKETSAEGLAEAMLSFQRQFGWDLMKVNPRASYHVEDWGARFQYSADPLASPKKVAWPVKDPWDWTRLIVLDVHQGALGQMLHAVRLIEAGLKRQVPWVMTIFTPLSVAGRLVASDQDMVQHLRQRPDAVHVALEVIAETFSQFASECLKRGASGIFLATTSWASRDLISEAEYQEFGRPYDLRVLEAASGAEINILHVCRGNNMLRLLADYPVAAFHWDATDSTNPNLAEGRELTGKAVMGGLDHKTFAAVTPEQVLRQATKALRLTQGRGVMLSAGCTIPAETQEANLRALRQVRLG